MTLFPDKHTFKVWRGTTFREVLTLYVDEGVTPRNLTGYSALMEIKDEPNGTVIDQLSTDDGRITVDSAGHITLLLTNEETEALDWSNGLYFLTITAPAGGDEDPLLYGAIVVKAV